MGLVDSWWIPPQYCTILHGAGAVADTGYRHNRQYCVIPPQYPCADAWNDTNQEQVPALAAHAADPASVWAHADVERVT